MTRSLPPAIVAGLEELGQALQRGIDDHHGASFAVHEAVVLAAVRAAAARLLGAVVEAATPDLHPGIATVTRRCPGCDQRTRMHSHRSRQVRSMCGVVAVRRPYYHCAACQTGFCPADPALDLDAQARLSAGVRGWLVEVGATVPYREAARLVERLTGLAVAAETVRAHALSAGEALLADEATLTATVQTTQAAPAVDPAPGMKVVEADGVMVRYQDGWHEVKVGLVGGVVDAAVLAASYVAAREPAEAFGSRLLAEAARRGVLEVAGWHGSPLRPGLAMLAPVHVLGDGASWIWNLAAEHFGERTEVLDYYHAIEHVWAVAHAMWGEQSTAAATWARGCATQALTEGGAAIERALRLLKPTTEAATVAVRREQRYFAAHADRMDYPGMRARGLPIGSGAVESAARHVIQQRMKRAGQRWGERGGAAMIALRARHASQRPLIAAA